MKKNGLFMNLHIGGCLMGIAFLILALVSCTEDTLDYDHPDVAVFVKQLKDGELSVQSSDGMARIPKFAMQDIGKLLEYADDLSVIPSFPLAPVSYSAGVLSGYTSPFMEVCECHKGNRALLFQGGCLPVIL